jgi:hypothetical protein
MTALVRLEPSTNGESPDEAGRIHIAMKMRNVRWRGAGARIDIQAGRTHEAESVFDELEVRYAGMARERGES